ncbi:hypothetical protein KEU06_15120 [Pseudaminobacter sp. 19-2017]|uniref:Uncharacterized protein n=1 Tax=Pseudaminobacter soli (ex Zhang et al. 2022) TaxID=2831468 RepID=A0A942E2H0_9HYPH|nr:hypothetical protein [Pseudaminobacter soli]MBS3649943.1 hypothetical protein [Pseudaminobacter soli]
MIEAKDLTPNFRQVRLHLAREEGHPEGDLDSGYDLLVPLHPDGRLNAEQWEEHEAQCRVRRFRKGEEDRIGVLRRRPDGPWYFDYDKEDEADDEIGFRFEAERFVLGEYVSVSSGGEEHTFRVARVERP